MPKASCTLGQILKSHRVLEPGACWALWHPCILVSAWILMCLAVVLVASLVAFLRSLGPLWLGPCCALSHPWILGQMPSVLMAVTLATCTLAAFLKITDGCLSWAPVASLLAFCTTKAKDEIPVSVVNPWWFLFCPVWSGVLGFCCFSWLFLQ